MTDDDTSAPGVSGSSIQPQVKSVNASWASSAARKVLSLIFKILFWFISRIFYIAVILGIIFAAIVLLTATGFFIWTFLLLILDIFDLIFKLDIRDQLNNWASKTYEHWFDRIQPITINLWTEIVNWSDSSGLSAVLGKWYEKVSTFGTELIRSIILLVGFLSIGVIIYHQRLVRRVEYTVVELIVAIVAMWVAIDGMSGGNFSRPYFISLFSGFYIMVRGLQNLDDGLLQRKELERKNGIIGGPFHAWVELWQALFYDSYKEKKST